MNPLENLPPFYIGQKVVFNRSYPLVGIKKGDIITVDTISTCSCGHHHVNTGVKHNRPATISNCSVCLEEITTHPTEYICSTTSLDPLIEEPFPSLTLSKVIEKELSLVSMN